MPASTLIVCAFNQRPRNEFKKLGPIPVPKARMNVDLHMAAHPKPPVRGNLFVTLASRTSTDLTKPAQPQIRVKVRGVDGSTPPRRVRSDYTDKIACWFIEPTKPR